MDRWWESLPHKQIEWPLASIGRGPSLTCCILFTTPPADKLGQAVLDWHAVTFMFIGISFWIRASCRRPLAPVSRLLCDAGWKWTDELGDLQLEPNGKTRHFLCVIIYAYWLYAQGSARVSSRILPRPTDTGWGKELDPYDLIALTNYASYCTENHQVTSVDKYEFWKPITTSYLTS